MKPASSAEPSTSSSEPAGDKDNLALAYEQLCTSYHNIDDFRSKLLGLLPIGTSIFLVVPELIKSAKEAPDAGARVIQSLSAPMGVFGFVISIGLFSFELYGIRKCTHLIVLGYWLEEKLGIRGQFHHRPDGVVFGLIDEPFAAGIIYPAVLAAWTFLAQSGSPAAWHTAIFVFALFGGISAVFTWWIKKVDAKAVRANLQKNSSAQPPAS